jgi:hypothetical protein
MSKSTKSAVVVRDYAAEYAAATGPAKAAVKREAEAEMKSALLAGDFDRAKSLAEIVAGLAPAKPEKAPVDYRQLVADRVATLRAAAEALESGLVRPAGVPDEVDLADLPEGKSDDETATKLAKSRIVRGYNSIQAAVDRAFDGAESGTFLTCTEIANRGATEDYRPSPGAVAARTDWDTLETTLEGVTPVNGDNGRGRGYVKN